MITTPVYKVVSSEGQSRVDVWNAATGKITTVPDEVYRKKLPSPYAWLERIAWNDHSDVLAFGVIFDGYPAEIVLSFFSKDGSTKVVKMPRPTGVHVRGYGTPLQCAAQRDQ